MLTRHSENDWYYKDNSEQTRHIQQELDQVYSEYITLNQTFWSEADLDTRFKAGDQSLYNDVYGNVPSFRKRQFYFNRIRRVTNMVTGYQRQHRRSTIVTPLEMSDDQTASQFSKAVFWAQKRADVDEVVSRAFDSGAVTTGLSLISCSMDFSRDPVSGDIECHHVPYNAFLIDPYFTKQDLSDCNHIWRRRWLTPEHAGMFLPKRRKEIEEMTPNGNTDGRFQFQAEAYGYTQASLLPIDEYYSKDTRTQKVLIDLNTGEALEWQGDDDDPQLEQFLRMYPETIVRETIIPTIKVSILVNGKLMYEGPTSLGIDRYPFVPVLGYYEPQIPDWSVRCQGMVRGLRDSQFLYNRRKIIELDILESQVNSGYKYKLDSLIDPNDVYLEGQGKGIALKQGADMGDVEKILPAAVPTSMIELSEILGREISEISGVNEELLGAADDDKAGVLAMLRQGAGLTTLQILFDQLDHSQKFLGHIFLEAIQKNFTASKIKRIINEEPTRQFYNQTFGKYDCVIEDGINTSTQRNIAFQQALHLREIGIPVPSDYILGLASVQDADKLKAAVAEAEKQAAEIENQKMAVELSLISAQKENVEAQALAATGYGLEHLARVRKNDSETEQNRAESIERIEQAKLDKVKAIKEISDMELSQIQRMVEIYNAIQVNENGAETIEDPNNSLNMLV